jgi:hypothetical protein
MKTRQNAWLHISSGDPHKATVKARSPISVRLSRNGPLAKFVRGQDSATINTFFVGQVADHVEIDGLELKVNWQLKRELNESWALGLEGFSEIEDLAHAGSFDEQRHRLGPVAYYEFPHAEGRPEWKAAGGVLFGLSDAVSDFTYKFDLEVEF